MDKKYLLGFDVGTSESKGTLTDLKGNVISTASSPHSIRSPFPGAAEHDPIRDWLFDLRKIVKELLEKSGGCAEEILAVGISTVMAAVTVVDEQCEPLRNAILYGIDTRCVSQAEEINEKIGREKMLQKFGTECTIEHFGAKILWIKENEPEIYARTKHITFASGFLTARLTGNYYVDKYSAASALPMLNPEKQQWDEEFCELICEKNMLPQIAESTYSIVGEVTKKAAKETGLAVGTIVICGTTDAGAEAVSVGVIDPGDTMLMYGSTAFYINVMEKKLEDSKLWSNPYTILGRYSCAGGMATTGSLTKWMKEEFSKDLVKVEKEGGENAYAALFKEAEDISVGSDGLVVLPYFQGERMPIQDPQAKGVFFGLNLRHTRGHLIHAVFEGIGYGICQNLDLLRNVGISLNRVTAVGGGTKSHLWLQIVSDICGITQVVPEITIGASYGDALMAGLGAGVIESPDQIKKLVKIKEIIEPDMDKYEQYKKYLNIYQQLYERNKDLMHEL